MQFNDTTNNTGIIQDIERFTGLGLGSISGNTTKLKDFTARVNNWLDRVVGIILGADNRWQWDDTNHTTLPIGTADIVSGQDHYTFDDRWLRVTRIEMANSGGTFSILSPIDQSDITQGYTTYQSTNGLPLEVDVIGASIIPKPTPNYNYDEGLKVFFQREPDYFTTGDTTQEPGFPSPFHRILAYGPACDYCLEVGKSQASAYRQEITVLEKGLEDFMGERSRYEKLRIVPRRYGYNPAR